MKADYEDAIKRLQREDSMRKYYARREDHHSIDVTPEAEEWWVQEVIRNRGKTGRNQECTPGYYNFEGEMQRRQDGNYNGGFTKYCAHMDNVRAQMEKHFAFTRK